MIWNTVTIVIVRGPVSPSKPDGSMPIRAKKVR